MDLLFYVIGSSNENELLLNNVLNCLYDTVSLMLRKNVEKRQMMKQLDGVFLAVDEICDRGIILEIEPTDVIDKEMFTNIFYNYSYFLFFVELIKRWRFAMMIFL